MSDAVLPDGYSLAPPTPALPDGYTLDVPQISGFYRAPAMIGSNLAKGALEGAGSIGDLQDLIQRGVDPLADALSRALGIAPASKPTPSALSSSNLLTAARYVGAVDRPDLAPNGQGEKTIAAAAEGAGSTLPFLPLASGGWLASGARGLAQGATAGVGGETAAELVPAHPDIARAVGGLAGAYGSGKMLNAGNRVAGAVMGNSTPTLDAYRNLGIDPTLAGDVTGSPTLQMMQSYAAKAPGGAARVHAASAAAVDQWGRALEDTAANLGNATTAQQAGEALQGETKNWLNQFKADSQQAWNGVDAQIPQSTPVPTPNYKATLSAVRQQMPGAPATAGTLQPGISRDLLQSLTYDTVRGPISWQDAKGIRTRIGEMISDPKLVGDTGYTDLKRIYGALSDDMGAAAAAQGPQAQTAFDQANALTRNGHGFIENVLSRLLKGNQISPEQAANAALNSAPSGGTLLGEIRQQMPQAADELAAYKLRDMGLANAGQQNAAASRVSPSTFLTDRAKLSPEALNALFADPVAAQRLQDLSTVGDSMKSTERFLNTSNTGTHAATGHAMAGFASAVPAAIEGYHLGGIPGAAGSLGAAIAAPYVPSFLAGRLTTSPALTRLLAAPPAVPPQSSSLLSTAGSYPQLRALLGTGALFGNGSFP